MGAEFPADLHYEPEHHLWVRLIEGRARVGLDALGQAAMGDVVYIQFDAGVQAVRRGEALGTVEAAKMVSPLRAPLSGRIHRINPAVQHNPALVNRDPYGQGWLVEIEPADWAAEAAGLLHGPAVAAWAATETLRYRQQGWVE